MLNLNFTKRKRKGTFIEMAPVSIGEAKELIELPDISFSKTDIIDIQNEENDDLEAGWIVKNPDNEYDKWFISIDYASENYVHEENMSFSDALDYLKAGYKVARKGWNGKNMFIFLVPGSTFKVSRPPLLGIYEEGTEINYHAHIDMKTATGEIVPWLASQTDMLADDWSPLV